jgi:hypothetical protein
MAAAACSATKDPPPVHATCGETSTCPNDPPTTQSDTDECRADLMGACAGQYQAYINCYADERVCAYDGTTDVLATEEACAEEASAVTACGDGGETD